MKSVCNLSLQQQQCGQNSSVPQRARGSSLAPLSLSTSSSSGSTHTRKPPRDRYGSNLLYSDSSSEDDSEEGDDINTAVSRSSQSSSTTTNHHQSFLSSATRTCRSSPPTADRANPFENFTVGKKSSSGGGVHVIGEHQTIRSSEILGQRSKNRLPLSATVAVSRHFNPLGQVEGCIPALVPENEEEERGGYGGRGSSWDNDGDLPIIDNWLVDDMSSSRNKDQPPAKRRKHQFSSGASRKEVRSFLEGSTSSSSSSATPSQRGGGGSGRKRPLQQKNNRTAAALSLKKRSPSVDSTSNTNSRRCTNDEQGSNKKKRKTMIVDDSSSSDSDERFLDSVIITEDVMDSDSTSSTLMSARSSHLLHTSGAPFNNNSANTATSSASNRAVGSSMMSSTPQSHFSSSSRPSSRNSSERQSSLFSNQSGSSSHPHVRGVATCNSSNGHFDFDSTATFNQITPSSEYSTIATASSVPNITTTSYNMQCSDVPPLFRVRVKIESKSYLIPCPRREQQSGLDTTIQWLISQASERHYAQQGLGARPRLSLTTSDGAIFCPTDLVSHVLSPNEEVVGVVEGWVEETLEESYLAVCKKEGVGEWKSGKSVCVCVCVHVCVVLCMHLCVCFV